MRQFNEHVYQNFQTSSKILQQLTYEHFLSIT